MSELTKIRYVAKKCLEKKMIHIQHIKLGALSMFLVLATVMLLSTIDRSHSTVLAQDTPSTIGSAPIIPASEASSDTNPLSEQIRERVTGALSGLSGSDVSDEQNTPLSGVEDETQNTEQILPLLEQITNITGTLSSNGLTAP
jgi:hypothetical protein